MILGWGFGLAVLGYYLFDIYENLFMENVDMVQIMNAFPEEMMAFFGGDMNVFEPAGFLHLEFFSYIPIILGIVNITNAANLITKKEEDGTLELILAQPISRSGLFWSKLFALVVTLLLILTLVWGGFALGLSHTEGFEIEQEELVLPFLTLFAVLMIFLALALVLSMILPTSGAASLLTGFFLIASWIITSLEKIDQNLENLNRFSPLKYYQGGEAIKGMNVEYFLFLLGISAVLVVLAWLLFEKRDLRFGGSGWMRLVFRKREQT